MRYYRCKCGERTMWSSMGANHNCQGCPECKTTFAEYPSGHEELQPHEWDIMYNQNTGLPYKICKKCSEIDDESFKASGKKLTDEEKKRYHENMQYIYESEKRDSERFVEMYKKKDEDLTIEIPPDDEINEDGTIKNDPTKDELPIPENLDEAIKVLTNDENIKFVNECKTEDEFIGSLHHGFGTGLRNGWGLWSGSVLSKWFNEKGIYHADDMSGIILTSLYRTVKGKDIKLDKQIKDYRKYWDKVQPDVNKGII